jgi:hypothetical protein
MHHAINTEIVLVRRDAGLRRVPFERINAYTPAYFTSDEMAGSYFSSNK